MNALVSVALCTYNGEKFLEEQIESLLNQTYSNIEIVVCDDASTDNTPAILKKFEGDSRFRILFNEINLGPEKNFQTVTQYCFGEFIAFCDQDDIWRPNKIELLVNAIGDNDLIYSDSELIDENGNSLHKKLSDLRNMYSGTDSRGFVFSNVAWGHAILLKKNFLKTSMPVPEGIPHDIWFAVKATEAKGIVYFDQPLNLYRQHNKTVTKTITTHAGARTLSKRYVDFQQKLRWIALMEENSTRHKNFYSEFKRVYAEKQQQYSWSLVNFMLKHRSAIFRFMRKSFTSQLIEILKQARKESS